MQQRYILALLLILQLQSIFTESISFTHNDQQIKQQIYWYDQKLDHYQPNDIRQWKQRYFVMDHYFDKTKQPLIILYICGEGECRGVSEDRSFTADLAKQFNGIVFSLEHRFYGESQPFGYSSQSYSSENLKYLTAQQALNDLASFIQWVKINSKHGVQSNMPWVTIGGSYPGALSAWFRYKFPHLTIGALASSAVVNPLIDFSDFDDQIQMSLSKNQGNCRQLVHEINKNVTDILQGGSPQQVFELKDRFNSTLLNDGDFMFFFSDITVMGVQYGNREEMCNQIMQDQTQDGVLNSIAQFAVDNNITPDQYGVYYLRNTTYSHERNARQWYYQVCSEFGWFFTPSKEYSMRSSILDLNYWKEWCNSAYDGAFPDVEATNNYFGGLDIQATNLIFTNGGEDPWQWASKRSPSKGMQSYIADCNQCAHCVDLGGQKSTDSPVLKDIRQKVAQSFDQWRKEHYAKHEQNKQKEEYFSIKNLLKKFEIDA